MGETAKKPADSASAVSAPSIVTSDQLQQTGRGSSKRIVMIVGTALCVLVVGTLVALYIGQHHKSGDSTAQTNHAKQAAIVKKTYATKDKTEKTQLDKDLAGAQTPQEKADVYVKLANNSAAQNDLTKALEYAQEAVKAYPSPDTYSAAGFRASQVKQYKLAAEFYGKAAQAYKQLHPDDTYEYQSYNDLQKEAESHK